jgi:hypothetical protein
MVAAPLIHIGMPKCGSTWLQRHFFNHKHGYHRCYGPLESHIGFISPRPFNWIPPPTIHLERAGEKVPVITAESLSGNPLTGGDNAESILHRLHTTLPQAKILIVIREQRAMLRSLYQLLVNWGSPYPIDKLINNDFAGRVPRFHREYLCYDRMISGYQNTFGDDRVLVLPMELFQSQPLAFLGAVNDFCEVDSQRYPIVANTGKRENATRSLASLECKRFYNRFIARTAFNVNGLVSPEKIQGEANFSPRVPPAVNRWQEDRFKRKVEKLTASFYAESNRNTQNLTGLDLSSFGYKTSFRHSP